MCGIAGVFNLTRSEAPDSKTVRQMLALLRHRGPDQFGMYLDPHAAMGSARLSIVDLAGGQEEKNGTFVCVINHVNLVIPFSILQPDDLKIIIKVFLFKFTGRMKSFCKDIHLEIFLCLAHNRKMSANLFILLPVSPSAITFNFFLPKFLTEK